MKKTKRAISALLVASFVLSVFGCSDSGSTAYEEGQKFPWVDSNLFENVDKMGQMSIKDDFASAANYEWAAAQIPDTTYGNGAGIEALKALNKKKRAMIEDESFQNKNIELVRTADGLFCDWEYRDSLGVEPLKKYLGYIDEIKTIDDVTAYMLDNEKNPFAISLIDLAVYNNEALDEYRALYIKKAVLTLDNYDYYLNFTNDAEVEKDKVETELRYIFGRCGYSDKEIKDTINGCFRFESGLAHLYVGDSGFTDVTFETKDKVLELAGDYPLEKMLDHYSLTGCDHFMGFYTYLDNLEKIYKQKNVEDMKAYFKARFAIESLYYLDAGAFDCAREAEVDRSDPFSSRKEYDPERMFFNYVQNSPLTAAMDQAYLDYYYDEETFQEVTGFVHLIKEKYIILIEANENLSDESKAAVKEKLDNMGEHIIKPDNTADFTGVELKSKEDGGSYLDALCVLNRIRYEHMGEMVQGKIPKNFWDIYDSNYSTTKVEAFYNTRQNTIYILLGALEEPMYKRDAPIEQKLASFVTILGHEVSHAFDDDGVERDLKGNSNPIVSPDEMKIWKETVNKMSGHFAGYKPFEGSAAYPNAQLIAGEVIADSEGMKVSLMIAKDYEDFDYDLYFRSFANTWKKLDTKEYENNKIQTDTHPLHFLRINYTVRQFDEFIETYDLKPGDGMYLDPSERILIW